MNALILVDIQNDFVPGGALPVPHGDEVILLANRLQPHFDLVVATQDWHPPNHASFASNHRGKKPGDQIDLDGLPQTLWPVHCVQITPGAAFASSLELAGVEKIFQKGTDPKIDSYSGFFDNGRRKATGLGDYLKKRGVNEVYVCGLATDYCVKFTALDARALGFETFLIQDACRGVELEAGDSARAVDEMKRAGVRVRTSGEILGTGAETITVWEGKHLRVRQCGHWEYVERTKATGGVVIVAVTDDHKLLLVEQYRVPMGKPVIELPAGLAGDVKGAETEELTAAAKRELLEETGYAAREMVFLMAGPSSAGLTNEVNTMFRANGLRGVAPGGGDEHEQIHLHAIPLAEVHGWLHRKMEEGLGVDPKVYAGLYFLKQEYPVSFVRALGP